MTTCSSRAPHEHVADVPALDGALRARLTETLASEHEIFFPFGASVAVLRPGRSGALLFAIFGREFPQVVEPLALIEDLAPAPGASASPGSFGTLGRMCFGSSRGLKLYIHAPLDGEDPPIARVLDALRTDAAAHVAYRGLQRQDSGTRQTAERILREGKTLSRTAASRADLMQAIADADDRLEPGADEPVTRYAEVLATIPAAPLARPAAVATAPKTPAAAATPESRLGPNREFLPGSTGKTPGSAPLLGPPPLFPGPASWPRACSELALEDAAGHAGRGFTWARRETA